MAPYQLMWLLAAIVAMAVGGLGSFTNACSNITLAAGSLGVSDLLGASCPAAGGAMQSHETSIDLNLCIGLDQSLGQLAWSYTGKYTNYCADCYLTEPANLTCTCKMTGAFAPITSTLNLDEGITTRDGDLTCLGAM